MRIASVSEAKNSLSALLDLVKAGETVVIADRGTPVARLEPLPPPAAEASRRARLERAGTLRRGTGGAMAALSGAPPRVAATYARSAVEAVVEERRSDR